MQAKYYSIDLLPGLMPQEQKLLRSHGINDTKKLLWTTRNSHSRQDLANKLKLNQKQIQKWAALADLARIPSVGSKYCGLILHGGVTSVSQLARTSFPDLHRQILRLQVATLQRKDLAPTLEQVKRWIDEAKSLCLNI